MSLKTIEVEIDIDDLIRDAESRDLVDELSDRMRDEDPSVKAGDLLKFASTEEMKSEIESRGEWPNEEINEAVDANNPSVLGHDVDVRILERFTMCHNLLTWEQWNKIFCEVEEMDRGARQRLEKKYDYV